MAEKSWLETVLDFIYGSAVDHAAIPDGVDGRSFSMHKEISWTGYSKSGERMDNIEKLKAVCIRVVTDPDLVKHDVDGDGKKDTLCNWGNADVAQEMGCKDIKRTMKAAAQIRHAGNSDKFRLGTGEEAAAHARNGGYAFAGKIYSDEAHVAALYPGPMGISGTWGRVPMVANVGQPPNGIKKSSDSFYVSRGEPEYFLYKKDGWLNWNGPAVGKNI